MRHWIFRVPSLIYMLEHCLDFTSETPWTSFILSRVEHWIFVPKQILNKQINKNEYCLLVIDHENLAGFQGWAQLTFVTNQIIRDRQQLSGWANTELIALFSQNRVAFWTSKTDLHHRNQVISGTAAQEAASINLKEFILPDSTRPSQISEF